tara:strand:- start:116 stop:349 length:234 start_codon:yes stop_codon:yes gene_type:complete
MGQDDKKIVIVAKNETLGEQMAAALLLKDYRCVSPGNIRSLEGFSADMFIVDKSAAHLDINFKLLLEGLINSDFIKR